MMWKQLSEELSAATARAAGSLVHVGGEGVAGRTGVVWGPGLVVTLARQASEGEAVPVVLPGGAEGRATVKAWDSRTGLTLLAVEGVADPGWKVGALPKVGSLALTVAFPSPQGTEARLDLVRFVGGENEWARGVTLGALIQTDSTAFPGFTGAAVIDADGALLGLVANNHGGNGGWIVPVADLKRMADGLVSSGSPQRAWLGVSTRPSGGQGAVLVGVEGGSPAERAGWKTGDLLVRLADQPVKEPGDLLRVLAGLVPGAEATARLVRDGEVKDLRVVPGGR
jgi:S1-C subfamily serine protease